MTAQQIAIMTDLTRPAWCEDYPYSTHPQFYRRLDSAGRDVPGVEGLHDESDEIQPRDLDITGEGDIYDVQTGEFLGVEEPPAAEPFRPTTREGAEWCLKKYADAEAQVLAIEARERVLMANLARQRKRHESKLAWLHRRFDADLEQFAREQLGDGKVRTLTLDHGRIAFRKSRGSSRIVDMDAAVDFVATCGYEAVVKVVKTVTTTDVIKIRGQILDHNADDWNATDAITTTVRGFLEETGPRETVTITAGIKE